VVLRGDQIVAAACVFPLTQRQGLSASIGMRHRAAMGLTEDTDAVVVAISEETGEISVGHRGHLVQGLDPDGLRAFLATTLMSVTRRGNWLVNLARRVLSTIVVRETPSDAEPDLGTPPESFKGPTPDGEAEKRREQPEQHGEARR
jgi:hypothetical protein